jgi:hypothetical protein
METNLLPVASKTVLALRLEALTPGKVRVLPSGTTWALPFRSSAVTLSHFV